MYRSFIINHHQNDDSSWFFKFDSLLLHTDRSSVILSSFKDTHREKAPSNKTPALTKSTNMAIWVVDISNQLLIRGS